MLGCDTHCCEYSSKCFRLAAQEAAEEASRSPYFPMLRVLPLSPLSLLRYINNILNIYSMPSSDRKMFLFFFLWGEPSDSASCLPFTSLDAQFPLCIMSWNWDRGVFTLRHWNTAALKLKPNNRNTLTFYQNMNLFFFFPSQSFWLALQKRICANNSSAHGLFTES